MTLNPGDMPRSEHEFESAYNSIPLVDIVVSACLEAKATNPLALDVQGASDIADHFVIVSGRSDRHVQGIANRVLDAAQQRGISPITIEGFEKGHWVLIDLGDVVLHVFYEPLRSHYNLENLWAEARPIDLSHLMSDRRSAA